MKKKISTKTNSKSKTVWLDYMKWLFITICFYSLVSCRKSDKIIENILSNPDMSTQEILRKLDSTTWDALSETNKNNYLYLWAKTQYKQKTIHAKDTLLQNSANVFLKQKEFEKACFLQICTSIAYQKAGQQEKALEILIEAENIAMHLKNKSYLLQIYHELGKIYRENNNNSHAKTQYQKLILLLKEVPELIHNLTKYNYFIDIPYAFLYLDHHSQAVEWCQKLLNDINILKDTAQIQTICYDLAYSFNKTGQYSQATHYIEHLLQLNPTPQDSAKALLIRADIYYKEDSIHMLQQTLQQIPIQQFSKNKNLYLRYQNLLAKLYYKQKQFQYAADILAICNKEMQEIYNNKKKIRLDLAREKYLQLKINQEHLKYSNQQLTFYITALIILIISAIIILCLYYRIRKRKSQYIQAYDLSQKLQNLLDNNTLQLQQSILHNLSIACQVAKAQCLQTTNKNFKELIYTAQNGDNYWKSIYEATNILHNSFQKRLTATYGHLLNEKEQQLCCLLRVGFDTGDIAFMVEQSIFSIQKRKTSIRKKLNMQEGEDIIHFLETKLPSTTIPQNTNF